MNDSSSKLGPELGTEPGDAARRLIRSSRRATLATALAGDGWPYASLVMVACGHDASPLLLMSDLAEHAKNLASDRRASVLFDGTLDLAVPLTGLRATLLGPVERCDDDAALGRYVRRHADAEMYLGLGDFHLYRMTVERAHVVAGFGAIDWLEPASILLDAASCGDLAAAEDDIVRHMNQDHADAVMLYAANLLGLAGDGWTMTGIDPEGVDLGRENQAARLDFDRPVSDAGAARAALVELADRARAPGKRAT